MKKELKSLTYSNRMKPSVKKKMVQNAKYFNLSEADYLEYIICEDYDYINEQENVEYGK